MSQLEKTIAKLKKHPVETRFEILKKILEHYNYTLTHSKGSHFRFKKENSPSITIVVHNGMVKKWYIKDVLSELNL